MYPFPFIDRIFPSLIPEFFYLNVTPDGSEKVPAGAMLDCA